MQTYSMRPTSWIGPERFVQSLVLNRAHIPLDTGHTTVHAAMGSGRSGSGRLHDLFVTLQTVAPGEYQLQGKGMTARLIGQPKAGQVVGSAVGANLVYFLIPYH